MALSPEQRIEIEHLVRERRAQLLADTQEDVERAREEDYGDVAGAVTDLGDRASADLIADLGGAEVSRDVRTLRELDAALARLEAGTYGICVDCGGDIELERLRAYPAALRCHACQQVHEKTYARPAEPRL